jgi:hypothetical protein
MFNLTNIQHILVYLQHRKTIFKHEINNMRSYKSHRFDSRVNFRHILTD